MRIMTKRNGYFQLMNANGITFIRLIPENGGGEPIDINELKWYLEHCKISNYNMVNLKKELENLKEEKTILLGPANGYPVNEYMNVHISEDKMEATVRFYPPGTDGKRIQLEEMKTDLSVAGVVYGIDYSVLIKQIAKPEYCTDFVIAKGKDVRQGTDAYIEYMFNTNRQLKPKHNEDGSVDFHQLDNISHINKGDTLAVLHPETAGESGINVFGEEIKPYTVKQMYLKYGKNIEITDDKLRIYSLVDGHATLEGGCVFVSNVYDVPGDVDTSTGDIEYEGNVVVHGNVRTGFKIKAAGNVEVFGSVEGAEIISGGEVILHHGIQGMTKGRIEAKGNVVTKFIESSYVSSEGYIEAEAIIQSQVSAVGDIYVNGSRGHIIGGHIRSSKMVAAKVIGSGMGISTIIEVGYNPEIKERVEAIKEKMTEENEEYKKILQTVGVLQKKLKAGIITNEQKMNYKKSLVRLKELKEDLLALQDQLDTNLENLRNIEGACVKVQRVIYPGTQLIILGEYYNILDEVGFCKFKKEDGRIRRISL